MAKGSSKESTLEHKRMIVELINTVIVELLERATVHDNAKMEDPELGLFDEMTPNLLSVLLDLMNTNHS